MKIRVALVEYLNAAPLGWFLLHGPTKGDFDVICGSPALCADRLACGEVEVAMIPSIEYQRIPDLEIIPGMAVTASSPVRSVLMVRNRGREIRSVALDTSSRTSVVLINLLLRAKMGLDPRFVPHAPDLRAMLGRFDAALLIGDAALKLPLMAYDVMDLAESWIEWQQRPFVFSFWTCAARRSDAGDLAAAFREGAQWGMPRREEIAEEYSRSLNLPQAFLADYLHRNIRYEFERPHQQGLEQFYELAYRNGLIPELKPIRYAAAGWSEPAALGR